MLGMAQLGLDCVPDVQVRLLYYLELLQKWNRVYNLTAIRQPEQMVNYHVLDSLAVLPHLWAGRWLDVGCGAGLPGLILALMRPEWKFVLLDSNRKKTSFVQQAKMELGLQNVSICCTRVEAWQAEEKFDGILSRAFSETAKFVTLTSHLLARGGRWVAMKGDVQQELDKLPNHAMVERVIPLQVPGVVAARCLVMLKFT